ncbi:MAG: acyl-CoA dehydrogenase family protein [Gemmatimonadales bacterium]
MDFDWSQEQHDFRKAVIRFAMAELTDGEDSVEWFRAAWKKCAEFGIQGLPLSPDFGGGGASHLTVVAALEALGYACLDNGFIFSLNAHMWACQHPIACFGNQEQKARYLPGLADGSLIGAHAMSEPGAGSDALALRTTATMTGNRYRLQGSKTFVSNAPLADVFIVFARTPGTAGFSGLSSFILEKDMPGLRVGPPLKKMGLHSSRMAEVFFDDCEVPAANLLGRPGFGMPVFTAAMELERSMILASTIGTMERTLERTLAYARERRQFEQPIGKFQAVSHPLVNMKLRLETARLLLYRLAWLIDHGRPTALDSALVKLHLSEAYVATSLEALQIYGGYGYMTEFGLEGEVRDALAARLYSGTSEIQRNLAARHLGL